MKKKIYILLALFVLSTQSFAKSENKKAQLNNKETQVEINLNNETLTSTNGIEIYYGVNRFQVFNVRRDEKNNKMYIDGNFTLNSYQPTGEIQIEGRDGTALLDGTKGNFKDTFGFMKVGQITGAEVPNDKIYFGGESTKFNNGVVNVENAWFTTDPKVTKDRDLTGLGYSLQSENIKIESGKQVTLINSDIFIKNHKILPVSFPWYRFNIRQGSKVPLFPTWGEESEYGWTLSQGVLYNSKDNKFRGGFAPKFGDQMGLLIGRMENWYKTDKYGESKLNINDLLVYKKADKSINPETNRQNLASFDRWDIDYTHKYSGEYGNLNFGIRSMTYNMNSELKDIIEDYDVKNKFNYRDKKTGKMVTNRPLGDIPDMGDYSNFYTLDTKLTGLGTLKDTTINAKVKLTDDKKAYEYMVTDKINDMGYGSQMDNELFSNVSIVKDNKDYTISANYNYLYDVDPGSNINDLESRREGFGFGVVDKIHKTSFNYDKQTGDKFRRLNSWERNPDLSKKKHQGHYGLEADYIPWTVSEYNKYDTENMNLTFGKYDLTNNVQLKTGIDYKFIEKELNTENDPLRKLVFGKNSRWSQYNRFENITYNKEKENRGYATFYTGIANLTVAGGKFEETVISREGVNGLTENSQEVYRNESDFYEVGLTKENIKLGPLGSIDILGNVRQDRYTKNNDKSTRYQGGLTHKINIFDNSENANRYADMSLGNEFTFFYQGYKYNGNKNDEQNIFINKEDIKRFKDVVSFEFGNTETIYTGEYTVKEKPITNQKIDKNLKNKIDFLVDGDKTISAYYNTNKKFDKEYKTNSNDYYNDLKYNNFGGNVYIGNHEIYYKNRGIDFKDKDFYELNEKIRENVYGYTYRFDENSLTFEYTQGTDKAKAKGTDVLDIDNESYAITYVDGGEIENTYGATYEKFQENYKNNMGGKFETDLNSNVITLRYGYKDKRLSEKELSRYARDEYGNEKEITSEDISKIRTILENRKANGFDFGSLMSNKTNFGEYRRTFDARLTLESKDDMRKEEGYFDSLSKIETSLFYSQERTGFGYTFTQKASGNDKSNWKVTEREHEFSFHIKFGKPSEGWRLRTFIDFYDNIDGTYADGTGRNFFDGIGVEIGKEMDYYEWSAIYKREYSVATRDYEWRAGIQFTLLTFPDNRLFGIGANGGSKKDQKTKSDIRVLNGIKFDD